MYWSAAVNQVSNCSGMLYGYQIWWEEPLKQEQYIAGVKGRVGSARINRRSNCLDMPYKNAINVANATLEHYDADRGSSM